VLLLQEHGIAPNIYFKNIYRVMIHRNRDLKKIMTDVPFKRIKLNFKEISNSISNGILDNSYPDEKKLSSEFGFIRKIVHIKKLPGEKVYNIEVKKAHTYVAMGVVNHNCPGQHDATRRAEPQPAIPKEFVPRLYAQRNFHFISSPSWVETEGLKNLVYHGPSIHDLISSVSFLDMNKPQEAMIELLKKRDLMPKYGGRNPYVPERKDYMVIKEVPDLVWIGDMHHNGYATYRGTTVINGGCWESQTEFEKKIGHNPTPGRFPMINLKTRQISEIYFKRNAIEKEITPEKILDVKV
jgi:hypothetical protein